MLTKGLGVVKWGRGHFTMQVGVVMKHACKSGRGQGGVDKGRGQGSQLMAAGQWATLTKSKELGVVKTGRGH